MPYRAGSVVTAGDAASTILVIGRPVGAAVDDIHILLFYVEDQSLTPSIVPGTWTRIDGASGEVTGSVAYERHVYWSRQGAESGNISISWGGASVWNVAHVAAYTGRINYGDPQDAPATFQTAAGTTLTAPALTTLNPGSDIIALGSNPDGSAYAWTGVTERSDFGGQSLADTTLALPGTSGNKTATVGSTTWAGSLIALRDQAQNVAAGIPRRRQGRPFSTKPGSSRLR